MSLRQTSVRRADLPRNRSLGIFGLIIAPFLIIGCQNTNSSPMTDQGEGMIPDITELGSLKPMNEPYVALVRHSFSEIGRDFDPYITKDSMNIVYASTSHSEKADIYFKKANGKVIEQVTHTPNASEKQPQLSPDGNSIIFASDREGKWNIYETSFRNRGSRILEVVNNGRVNEQPCYSPDGRDIAYSTWIPRKGQWYIATMNRRTQQERLYGPGIFPKYSPDGKKILFQRPRTRSPQWFSIWVLNLETENVSEIVSNNNWAAVTPNWSPDSKKIIFAAINKSIHNNGPHAGDDIYTIWEDGTHMVRLTNDDAPDWNPIWSESGRIYFVSRRNGHQNIWSLKPRDMDPFHPDTVESGPSALDSL